MNEQIKPEQEKNSSLEVFAESGEFREEANTPFVHAVSVYGVVDLMTEYDGGR